MIIFLRILENVFVNLVMLKVCFVIVGRNCFIVIIVFRLKWIEVGGRVIVVFVSGVIIFCSLCYFVIVFLFFSFWRIL